jgi:hypothetical protein
MVTVGESRARSTVEVYFSNIGHGGAACDHWQVLSRVHSSYPVCTVNCVQILKGRGTQSVDGCQGCRVAPKIASAENPTSPFKMTGSNEDTNITHAVGCFGPQPGPGGFDRGFKPRHQRGAPWQGIDAKSQRTACSTNSP